MQLEYFPASDDVESTVDSRALRWPQMERLRCLPKRMGNGVREIKEVHVEQVLVVVVDVRQAKTREVVLLEGALIFAGKREDLQENAVSLGWGWECDPEECGRVQYAWHAS